MKRLLIVTMFALGGCATTENYEAIVNSWVGEREVDLVRAWGAPVNVYDAGGSRFISYESSSEPTYTTTFFGGIANTSREVLRCVTTFEIKDSVIAAWQFQGNNCTARNPQ